ncbi:MAG: hypothetical protein JXR48_07810 [Candidatus Delongbacteria bacterium]|nr:hypothetical protein [Candidatus Delongbacteria bacterium]MBN2834857.1 hypothetical protein [Candidatus Delongbacteria bacterium]
MKNNLILIEGIPGTGKSTLSQFLAIQLEKNIIKSKWFHEAQENHFIEDDRLDPLFKGDTDFINEDLSIDEFIDKILELWNNIVEEIQKTDEVVIVDSKLNFINTILIYNDASEKDIMNFWDKFETMTEKVKPLFIHLYIDDVKKHLVNAWTSRSQWAFEHAISYAENVPYISRLKIKKKDVLTLEQETKQNFMKKIYKISKFDKMSFEVSEKSYYSYENKILEYLGLNRIEYKHSLADLRSYEGFYENSNENLQLVSKENVLLCDWGYKNLILDYIGEDVFILKSYPVYFKFYRDKNGFVEKIETYGEQVFGRADCKFTKIK